MAMFVVIHAHGAPWDATRSLREQDAWDQHAQARFSEPALIPELQSSVHR
jgi:hypothetical protein